MSIVRISHPNIAENESTRLTATASDGGTSLTVQNTEGFVANDYIVVGKLGEEKTELRKIGSVTADFALTVDTLLFNHPINTPVTFIGFNQVDIHSATTKTGTYSACTNSPVAIEVDQDFTEFDDTAGDTTTWYKVRYYNSTTGSPDGYSTFSDLVQGSGYTEDSLRKMIDKANAICNDRKNKVLTLDEKIDIVNDGYQIANNRLEKADHKRFVKKGYVDIKDSYNTGTVSVDDGDTAVTGSSTVWVTSWVGKKIIFGNEGFPYDVASFDSTTGLTLTVAYKGDGDDLSGETYKVYQNEYDLYNESTGVEITDFKKIEQVIDENGIIVGEYDLHRTEQGYYLKRQGDNLKFCVNYIPSTSGIEGRWTVWYRYQPAKLDSMADEPEFPQGYSGLLVAYLSSKIWERIGDMNKAAYYIGEFTALHNKLIKECVPRTNEKKGFRIDRNLRAHKEHDADWIDDIYSRKTIGT